MIGAADDREDRVTLRARVGEPAQHEHAAALAAHVAVGARVEGPAAAGDGEHAGLAAGDEGLGAEEDVDAAGQRELAAARAQALDRVVQRDQRGGAGRVDRHARALHLEEVGDAPRDRAGSRAGGVVTVEGVDRAPGRARVLAGAHAHEHAGARRRQRARREAGALERLPADLEDKSLLRVHGRGLARRDREELRIELLDVVDEAAVARVGLAGGAGRGRVQLVDAEAAPRDLGDRVATLAQQVPESLGRVGAAGEAAAHADDRDRLARASLATLEPLDLPLEPLDHRQRLMQRRWEA